MLDLRDLAALGSGGGVARQLVLTAALLALVIVFRAVVTAALQRRRPAPSNEDRAERRRFWVRQSSKLVAFGVLVAGLALIWFNDPTRFATIAGLLTAGIAVALRRGEDRHRVDDVRADGGAGSEGEGVV